MAMKIGQAEKSGQPGQRDAFHVTALLVQSYEKLKPGDSVVFIDDNFDHVRACLEGQSRHGVIDPFLEKIEPYDLFWVLLLPEFVNNLTHKFQVNVPGLVDYEYQEDDDPDGCKAMGCS